MSATASSVDMIRTLIGFPTVSRDSNLELIHFVRDYLKPYDADMRLTFDDTRSKANLFATLGPRGNNGEGGIVLSGHTDVVPVAAQAWDADPFKLIEREGKLYGRGTADMKGFIAIVLALLPEFMQRGLKKPLHLAFSYDEEVGCIGVGRMINDLVANNIRPSACIVGEPTMMTPVIAHKGKKSYRVTVRGLASHSAYAPNGVNAVEAAAEAVAFLKTMARRHASRGPFDRGFDVSHTTVHTGVMQGGTALNIVPHECSFDFEFRHLPGDDPEKLFEEFKTYVTRTLEPEMRAVYQDAGFDIQLMSQIPAMDNSPETEVVALAQALSGNHEIGKVSYGTEGSQFQRAGISTVVCGPGSIEQAHKPNEFVALEQVTQCEAFLRGLMARVCEK
jgi:acetylornithine deacetylase